MSSIEEMLSKSNSFVSRATMCNQRTTLAITPSGNIFSYKEYVLQNSLVYSVSYYLLQVTLNTPNFPYFSHPHLQSILSAIAEMCLLTSDISTLLLS